MKNNKCIIVSIGTSLIENIAKINKGNINFDLNELDVHLFNDDENIDNEINIDNNGLKENLIISIGGRYYKNINDILQYILKNTTINISELSAELKTIFKLNEKEKINEGDLIYLFPTNTKKSILCSLFIADLIKKNFNINIFIVITKLLKQANDRNFAEKGLPEFLSNLTNIIKKHIDEYKIYILPTGGYKALIPYMVLLGILFNKPENPIHINYIYEESDVLLDLPILPIGINIYEIKPNYQKIRTILSIKNFPNIDDFIKSNTIKNLLNVKNGNYELNTFGELIINDLYLELEHKSKLDIQASNILILEKLKRDNDKPDLLKYYKNLIEIGSKFWIGDKLPEMVDHALYHHNNLFEITDIILTYLFNKKNDFLKPEELFILLSSIYFHDWGHVISYYIDKNNNKIPLLPYEIRDFHHILSFQRIKNNLVELYNDLKWGNDKDDMFNNYLNIIGHVCLYHRNNMPLKRNRDKNFKFYLENNNEYKPLEDEINNLKFEGKKLNDIDIDLLFITSLFRVIDSLDTQYLRIGSEEELKFKFLTFISDIESEESRLERIMKDIYELNKKDEYNDKCLLNELNNIYNKIINSRKDNSYNPRSDLDRLNFNNYLSFSFLENKFKIYFKTEQLKHFFKHLYFESPRITYQENNSCHEIIIDYYKNKNFDAYEKDLINLISKNLKGVNLLELEQMFNEPKKIIKNEISKDYENDEVKKLLESKKLRFIYKYNGEDI